MEADIRGRREFATTERTPLLYSSSRKCARSASEGDAASQSITYCPSQMLDDGDSGTEDRYFYSSARSSRSPPHSRTRRLEDVSWTLQNSGSVARDHLASERTFLSYIRTSLAIASAGIALVQLFSTSIGSGSSFPNLRLYIRALGIGSVITGILVLLIGVTRYFTVQAALVKGLFPVARLATAMIAVMLTVLVTMAFGMLLAGRLQSWR